MVSKNDIGKEVFWFDPDYACVRKGQLLMFEGFSVFQRAEVKEIESEQIISVNPYALFFNSDESINFYKSKLKETYQQNPIGILFGSWKDAYENQKNSIQIEMMKELLFEKYGITVDKE